MSYSAKSIANYFIERAMDEDKPLTPMKLLKLVYIAHGWWLGFKGEPLIDEQVEACKFGPVITSLYHEFKSFGMSPITKKATKLVKKKVGGLGFAAFKIKEIPTPEDTEVLELLDAVWEGYGQYDGIQLSNLTHEEGSPWHQTWLEYNGKLPRHTDIPTKAIRDYYAKVISEQD